jgi:hypothetical protein
MSDAVVDFLKKITPPAYDRSEVATRREVISKVLNAHSLQAGYLVESGSFAHGTGIANKSDVDYIAWASAVRPQRPSSALQSLKSALAGADWKITSVNISSPTVQVTYYTPPNFEIVPAFASREIGGYRVWDIPGRGDDWVQSSPAAHKQYVNSVNDALGKRVKAVVRLAKAWKYHAQAPVSSFYMEMRVAEYCKTQTTIIYELDLRYALNAMVSMALRDMNDPAGIVGRIPACSSEEKRATTLRLMRTAVDNLERAWAAEQKRDAAGYWSAMTGVFGYDFPWPAWP